MKPKSLPVRAASIAAVSALGVAAYLSVSTVSRAQAGSEKSAPATVPDAAALQKKVKVLEKQVEALQSQVAELKRQRGTIPLQRGMTLVIPPNRITTLPNAGLSTQPTDPSLGTPFEFNGRTYYRMLLKNGEQASGDPQVKLAPGK